MFAHPSKNSVVGHHTVRWQDKYSVADGVEGAIGKIHSRAIHQTTVAANAEVLVEDRSLDNGVLPNAQRRFGRPLAYPPLIGRLILVGTLNDAFTQQNLLTLDAANAYDATVDHTAHPDLAPIRNQGIAQTAGVDS